MDELIRQIYKLKHERENYQKDLEQLKTTIANLASIFVNLDVLLIFTNNSSLVTTKNSQGWRLHAEGPLIPACNNSSIISSLTTSSVNFLMLLLFNNTSFNSIN